MPRGRRHGGANYGQHAALHVKFMIWSGTPRDLDHADAGAALDLYYARFRALEGARLHSTDEGKVEEAVAARMRRQEVLYDTSKTFQFVVCEAALRYLLCPPQVMLAKLDRLLGVLGLRNVTLGIIPPGRELTVAPMADFLIADEVTVVETFTSADILRGKESAKYAEFADLLMSEAVTGDEARRLIMVAAASLRNDGPQD